MNRGMPRRTLWEVGESSSRRALYTLAPDRKLPNNGTHIKTRTPRHKSHGMHAVQIEKRPTVYLGILTLHDCIKTFFLTNTVYSMWLDRHILCCCHFFLKQIVILCVYCQQNFQLLEKLCSLVTVYKGLATYGLRVKSGPLHFIYSAHPAFTLSRVL